MSKNESRVERKSEDKNLQGKSKASLNKVYYWIIAFLFLVLFVLVLFIFNKSGDKVDLIDDEENTEQVEGESNDNDSTEEDSNDEEITEAEQESEENDENNEEQANSEDQEDNEDEEDNEVENAEDETAVNEDAPHDSNYAINYNSGSADRIAIKEEIMKVTGLGSDLTEYWVGNNGPGRVKATVANPDKSKIYEVELQYGDGNWHVTNYQSLNSLPENFN